MLDGACRVADVIDTAIENNMPAVAITDHGVMYGAIDFYQAGKDKGIKPIIGCETYITPGSRFRKEGAADSRNHHLVLLATNLVGYHNLIKLVSSAHLEGLYYKPRIDPEILETHHDGLIGLSACLKGEVATHLQADNLQEAIRVAGRYRDILGSDNFFLEIQDHGIAEQRKVNTQLANVSQATGIPLVATNDTHYLKKEHASAHEVLLCLQTQTVMSDEKRMRYSTDQFYLKSREEMETVFREFPEALDITLDIAERCSVELEFGKLHFPTFDVPRGRTQATYLTELAHDGIKTHYGIADPNNPRDAREKEIMDRFHQELAIIERTGFINYFLVVWDFVHFAREERIPVGPGRGSGGGSLIAFALEITTIDPLRYDLIFERFLNLERVSPPDFDIDFCQTRRGEVIDYVKRKYGRENVAQIITFGSLGAKSVIRDVGRVLEIPYLKRDQLAKMIPDDPKMNLKRALEMSSDFKNAYENDSDCTRILDYAFVLEGLYRNPGTHAAGVVIGEKPLVEIIPLSQDKDHETVTQYTMEPLGEIGLLKMDFLGLKTLTVLQESVCLIKKYHGVEIDLENLPFDDAKTYELLNRGDTVGVFQLESSGMRDLVRRIGIDRIEDLIAMIALYRPGPMNMLPDYVDRKSGKQDIKYDHPLLEPILKETYGVMVYQEQVQKAANVLAGYSLGEADVLRRAMGKKKREVMEEQRADFIAGCAKTNRISARVAGRIFDNMEKFAGYGFGKAHSAGYAIIAYQTAHLKANFPAEFMAALLSSEIGNFEKIPVFAVEADEMGLQIKPPDVNESGVRFTPGDNAIRFGLAGVKNVGEGAAEAVVCERDKNGPFTSMVDFCSRVDSQLANKKVLESLVRCGAMDAFGTHRARLFNGVDFAMARASEALSDRMSGQGSLFDLMAGGSKSAAQEELPPCEPWHEGELLAGERELLGVYMTGHPLTQYASLLKRYQLTTVQGFARLEPNTMTRIGGIISSVTKRVTKARQQSMAILQLEDLDGSIEVLVFPEVYEQYADTLRQDAAILVCGEVSFRDEQPKLLAYEVYPLADAPRFFATRLSIHVPTAHMDNGRLKKIRDILRMHPGSTPVFICLQFPKGEKVFLDTEATCHVLADEDLVAALEHELGEDSVYVGTNPQPCRKGKPRRKRGRNGGASP